MSSLLVRQMLGEAKAVDPSKNEPRKVIEAQRPVTYHVCPHCQQEIFEKHTYSEDNGLTERHSDCGGVIEWPELPLDSIWAPLRPFVEKTRLDREALKAKQ